MMGEHLVFFDGECPFCHRSVRYLIEIDVHKRLLFAPLNGKTASEILIGPQAALKKANSLVLVENYQSTHRRFWIRSKAIFKAYWLIGNGWGLIGVLSFLPSGLGDFFYRWFAAHRHQFKLKMPQGGPDERFLQ
jgi:predicted DCC family thiol-disulfide oxidoreductase YuxK